MVKLGQFFWWDVLLHQHPPKFGGIRQRHLNRQRILLQHHALHNVTVLLC